MIDCKLYEEEVIVRWEGYLPVGYKVLKCISIGYVYMYVRLKIIVRRRIKSCYRMIVIDNNEIKQKCLKVSEVNKGEVYFRTILQTKQSLT